MLTSEGAALTRSGVGVRLRSRRCRGARRPPGVRPWVARAWRPLRAVRCTPARLAAWLILSAAPWCAVAPAVAQVNGAAGAAADPAAPDEFAEPERGQEVRFEPAQFGVGDRVLARIVVRGAAQLTAPGTVAAGEWLSVHGVDVLPRTDGSWEVRVLFTSYRPGVGELPPIDVGPFQLTGIGFLTVSVLPRYGDVPLAVRPPAAQMAVPGSAALLIGGALAVLVVPYLLVSGGLLLAGAGGRVRARRARTRPRLLLERGVQQLQTAATAATAATGATAATAAPPQPPAHPAHRPMPCRSMLACRTWRAATLPSGWRCRRTPSRSASCARHFRNRGCRTGWVRTWRRFWTPPIG